MEWDVRNPVIESFVKRARTNIDKSMAEGSK